MDIGINDLDFDQEESGQQQETAEEQIFGDGSNFEKPWMGDQNPHTPPSTASTPETAQAEQPKDIITELLNRKGIKDPNQIKFEDENGQITPRQWKDLTTEEQLNILDTPEEESSNELDDEELKLINNLRLSKMTPEEFIQKTKNDGIKEYTQTLNPEKEYEIDDISDDDLYVYDLKSKISDITDEELALALQKAKETPELFAKQMAGIRQDYKQLEDERDAQKQAEEEEEQKQKFVEFQNNIGNAIQNMNSVGSLDISLDDDDKEELAEFILGQDQAGNSYLGKALNDPETLTRMAWFALKGADALDEIQDYFTKQITTVRQQAYQKGIEDGRKGNPHVVVQTPKKEEKPLTQFGEKKTLSINELD